jgi:dTDP-4-amino-4,6-dideoxygalactose transaminase
MQIPFVDLKAQYSSIKEEIDGAVHAVLDSARYVSGEWVEKFENEFARYVGAKYAIGVGSGTAALELALKAAHIGPGDEVIVPANSFIATAEAVSNIGAKARFADVDPTTFHLDAASVEQALTPKTRAVIPVHLYGRAMDLTGIENLAARHHLEVIEDAAQAHGAERSGTKVGGSGRLTCFSFYPTKNLGAYGDAGAITTNDARHAENLRLLRDHGSRVKHQHLIVGTNSRLDSIQAAVLSVKLRYLEKWNSARRNHASVYAAALKNSAICPPQVPRDGEHIFHLFVIRTPRRDDLKKYLASRGIGTDIHYPLPLHLTDAYKNFAYSQKGRLSVSERLAAEVLSLPMYPELSEAQIEYVARALLQFAGGAYA